jgi:glucose/arabinose dehydrogenase
MKSALHRWLIAACLAAPASANLIVNAEVANPAHFRVTTFAQGLGYPYSMQRLSDGSIAVLSSPGFGNGRILRFADADGNGIADGPGQQIYSTSGALTGFAKVGDLYAVGNHHQKTITLLKPGAGASDAMTPVGTFALSYPEPWTHSSMGLTARQTPGVPGSYDLIFNIGSRYDKAASDATVGISGLINGTLNGDSLYSVTLDLSGSTPVANNLHRVAAGIRNVAGMGFRPGTGDFYFADNAMDQNPGEEDPIQADELNFIGAVDFGITVPDFGFPTCYVQYKTGTQIGSGCVDPLAVFQPIPPSSDTAQSEGPVEIAFAPAAFPGGFNNGVFIGFSGKNASGPANEENAVVYYDIGKDTYVHFVKSGLPGMAHPNGLLTANNSLFIADPGTGKIYQISSAVPEPATTMLLATGLAMVTWLRRKRVE